MRVLDFLKTTIGGLSAGEDEIVKTQYKPANGGLGDCCFAADETGVHCFYIWRDANLPADCHAPGNECRIGHSFGRDIFSLNRTQDALCAARGEHLWAPSIVRHEKHWFMFYTHVTARLYQSIRVAVSDDLYHWTAADTSVIDVDRFIWARFDAEGYTNCRDPYVTRFSGLWYCYYTAQLPNGNAAMGVAVSADLRTWQDKGFCLERTWQNDEGMGTELCESPCVFTINGLYYLVYSHGMGLRYAVSDDPADFRHSPVHMLYTGRTPDKVPYNFELLDAETGLFGYLCGGYYSYAAFGFISAACGKLTVRRMNSM